MRRIYRPKLLVAGAAAALLLTGFGISSSAATAKIHLTMWQQWGSSGPNAVALNAAIKQYEQLNPNVTITSTYITNDAKILAAISGHNPPDLIDLGTSIEVGSWGAAERFFLSTRTSSQAA